MPRVIISPSSRGDYDLRGDTAPLRLLTRRDDAGSRVIPAAARDAAAHAASLEAAIAMTMFSAEFRLMLRCAFCARVSRAHDTPALSARRSDAFAAAPRAICWRWERLRSMVMRLPRTLHFRSLASGSAALAAGIGSHYAASIMISFHSPSARQEYRGYLDLYEWPASHRRVGSRAPMGCFSPGFDGRARRRYVLTPRADRLMLGAFIHRRPDASSAAHVKAIVSARKIIRSRRAPISRRRCFSRR